MENRDKFQLVVYEGDFSLPSIEPESIKSIVYCAIARVPVEVKLFNTYKSCLFYNAPTLIHKNLQFKYFKDIVMYLKTVNFNPDRELNPKQCSESLALTNFVQSKLKPVIVFNFWIEPRNCNELTDIWHMRSLPIPFNYLYVNRFRDQATDLIESLYPNETDMEVVKEYIQRAAVDCLSNISVRLGNNDYFYGTNPTMLDVCVYAYIAPFIKAPLPLNEMKNMINMWPNLINLVKKIDTTYFPDVPKGSKYIKIEEKSKTSDDEVSYVAIVILTLSATSLALGFAYSRGYLTGKLPY